MQEQDKMAKDFSKRHWQAFKANIEKRKQIQTQIAVIHNVWEQQADASQVDKHVIRLERVYEPFIYSQKGSIDLYIMVINVVWLSSPRAESARAVTGRRCPYSGRGEDFLSRQPDFLRKQL